jgi:predicted nucleic acid-binding protein
MYLVDTNVLSASAPTKAQLAVGLVGWMDRNSALLFLSVVTVAEIEDGIAKARREGAHRKADRLAEWLETLLHLYALRILPLDIAAARILGGLSDLAWDLGQRPGFADLAIAATAQRHDLSILTRSLRHFRGPAVRVHDPFDNLPLDGVP